jgi:hypothetical protein
MADKTHRERFVLWMSRGIPFLCPKALPSLMRCRGFMLSQAMGPSFLGRPRSSRFGANCHAGDGWHLSRLCLVC